LKEGSDASLRNGVKKVTAEGLLMPYSAVYLLDTHQKRVDLSCVLA
jgi:hypothetical protein